MTFEGFENFCAIRRRDVVGDKRFGPKLTNLYFLGRCQWMLWMNDKSKLVLVHYDRAKSFKLRSKGEHSHLHLVVQNLLSDLRSKGALDCHLDHRTQASKLFKYRQQIHRGEFVGSDGKLP